MQSVSITTKVVSSNPVDDEVYSIQHYVIEFVSDLRQIGGFLRVLRFLPPIKLTPTNKTPLKLKRYTTRIPPNNLAKGKQFLFYAKPVVLLTWSSPVEVFSGVFVLSTIIVHLFTCNHPHNIRVARSSVFCVMFCRS